MKNPHIAGLLVVGLVLTAEARAAELRDIFMPPPAPGVARSAVRWRMVYSGHGLVLRLARVDGGAPIQAVTARMDSLVFPLQRKLFVFEGRREALGRGDFLSLPAGTERPGRALADGAPLDALIVAPPAGSRPSGARRTQLPRETRRLFSALRASVDVLPGPWRSTSAHAEGTARVSLIRPDAAMLVENPSAVFSACLLPVEGAAEAGPESGAVRLQGDAVLILDPGEKVRVAPAPGGPFYAYLITR